MKELLLVCGLAAMLVPASASLAKAESPADVTFNRVKYSSPDRPREMNVTLSATNSQLIIKTKKHGQIDKQIPYTAIDSMSYEWAQRHRVGEGAAVMALSLGAGAILMATKTKSHWLAIEHHDGATKEVTVLRLDKSDYNDVISALEQRTGKQIARLDSKTSALNPTAQSKNMDEVVPFRTDSVTTAMKLAMASEGCNVTNEEEGKIECKRPRGYSERTGAGGEKVTATIEPQGDQTHVRVWTSKGAVGRMAKKNWSTAIFQEMLKRLQSSSQKATS